MVDVVLIGIVEAVVHPERELRVRHWRLTKFMSVNAEKFSGLAVLLHMCWRVEH